MVPMESREKCYKLFISNDSDRKWKWFSDDVLQASDVALNSEGRTTVVSGIVLDSLIESLMLTPLICIV